MTDYIVQRSKGTRWENSSTFRDNQKLAENEYHRVKKQYEFDRWRLVKVEVIDE